MKPECAEDRDGLTSVAQGGPGGDDGLTGLAGENEENLLFRGDSTVNHEGVDGSSVVSRSSLSVDEGRVSVPNEGSTHEKSSQSTDKDLVYVQSEGSSLFNVASAARAHTWKRLPTKVAAKVEPRCIHIFWIFCISCIFQYSLGPKDLRTKNPRCVSIKCLSDGSVGSATIESQEVQQTPMGVPDIVLLYRALVADG